MTNRPDVTIVLCTYNRAASLRLTLASLAAQITPPSLTWDLLVVDNNSTDATHRVIDEFTAAARISVRALFVARQGLSHARNAGVHASPGHIIGFTDDDVHAAADWVASIATVMTRDDAEILGGRILPAWHEPPPAWLQHRSFHGMLTIADQATRMPVANAQRAPCVWGANMAFRREVFDKVGLFDTRRGLMGTRRYSGEDTELVERALAAGFRAVYDPSVLVWHRIGPDRMRIRYLSRVCFDRAEGEARIWPPASRLALVGFPLGLFRSAVAGFGHWLAAFALRRPDTIQRWLDCCAVAGSMWGTWRWVAGRRLRRVAASHLTFAD
jgi:GT2 family glycosyltransferase